MSQTKGSPQYGETVLTPEVLSQSDATWTGVVPSAANAQTTLDWGAALAAADTRAIASGSNSIVIQPGTYNIASNRTITSNVLFQPGAQLSINSGKTVTFNGLVWGPQTQIFAGSGTATLSGTDQMTFGAWTGGTGVTFASGVTISAGNLTLTSGTVSAGAIAPNAIYVSTPIINASSTTTYSFEFVVPNDGPTWKVAAVSYRYHVAGPAALTFNVTADASGTAVGGGTNQLQAGADLHSVVADTVANGTVLASPTTLAAGATLGLVISSATQTGLAALQVTAALQRVS